MQARRRARRRISATSLSSSAAASAARARPPAAVCPRGSPPESSMSMFQRPQFGLHATRDRTVRRHQRGDAVLLLEDGAQLRRRWQGLDISSGASIRLTPEPARRRFSPSCRSRQGRHFAVDSSGTRACDARKGHAACDGGRSRAISTMSARPHSRMPRRRASMACGWPQAVWMFRPCRRRFASPCRPCRSRGPGRTTAPRGMRAMAHQPGRRLVRSGRTQHDHRFVEAARRAGVRSRGRSARARRSAASSNPELRECRAMPR